MNEKTARWLQSIKIHPSHINEAELQNGSLFGLIFEKMNLLKDKKFKNSQDLACIFQNFKNTKDLLYDHFGIVFPANEIIYRSDELLEKVKEACEEYEKNKKETKLNEIKKKYLPANTLNNATLNEQKLLTLRQNEIKQQTSTLNGSLNPNRTFSSTEPKLPPKILEIEKKLSKFRDEQTRHELLSLETRKQELETINQAIQDHRYFEISKLKMNHEMKKEFEKKVAEVVAKTEEKKQERIDKEQQFFRFMKSKKDNFLNSIKQEEQMSFTKGLEDFQLNCLRQGIELEHDPSKPYQPKEDNFNSKVMLERIKDNMKRLERERKERQKRVNSKNVESEEANVKSQQVWEENYLLDRLEKNVISQEKYIKETLKAQYSETAEKEEIQLKLSKKTHKPLPEATEQEREEFEAQIRANRLIFYDKEIERLEKRDMSLKAIAREALESLIYTTIVAEEAEKDLNFTYSEWKSLERAFLDYEAPLEDRRKKEKSKIVEKEPREEKEFIKYLQELVVHELSMKGNIESEQEKLGEFVNKLIEKAYPKASEPEKLVIPLYMPLRIGVSGNRLSGKTTQIKKLLAKYPGLVLIDPKKILTEAFELARPQPQNDDPKKKKDSKKPEEESPEKLELKKFGEQILAEIKNESQEQTEPKLEYESLDFKYTILAIKWKLEKSFQNLSPAEIKSKYHQCEEQEKQRIKDFEKNQEEKNKKKDSKKPATEVVQESPVFNDYFYTEGFVLDNVDLSEENLRKIEKELNGFIKIQERLNPEAERLREELGKILPIKKSEIPENLNKGFFNIVINIDESLENQEKRNEGRKMDPTTGEIYHPIFNPYPTDVKGLAERLVEVKKVELETEEETLENKRKREEFYRVFGYENEKYKAFIDFSSLTPENLTAEIISKIERFLRIEYKNIDEYTETEQRVEEQPEKQSDSENLKNESEEIKEVSSLENINNKFSLNLLERISSLKQTYTDSVSEPISELSSLRHEFEQSLLSQQREFIEIINRPDDKANRILTFQDNYNKLLEEKSNIINDKSAIAHLVSKLDELYDSLWVNIEAKKNQAISFRKSFLESSWLNNELEKIVEKGKSILQAELNYLVDILSFILLAQIKIESKETDPVVDYLCLGTLFITLGIPKENESISSLISSESENKVSHRLQFYLNQVESCLESLPEWFSKKQLQSKTSLSGELQQLADSVIEKQKEKLMIIQNYIKELVYSCSQEEVCYFNALINKMDDWIIVGIKEENDFTYDIYKTLKSTIENLSKSQLKDLFPTPITVLIKPIERLTPLQQPFPLNTNLASLFQYSSFKIFLEEIKCLSFTTNSSQSSETLKINFTRFKEYFNKRKKSKLLDEIYLRLDFDSIQQYLVTDNEISFKEIALAMLMWNMDVLDEETLNVYEAELSGSEEKSTLSSPNELSLSPFIKSISITHQELNCLQHLIFDILQNEFTNQVEIKEYLDLLNSFNSLQLLKYGDSLMLLDHHQK